jgi:hypothetical protein
MLETLIDIKPIYADFETSKLLKEKGFNVPVNHWYEYALTSKKDPEDGYGGSHGWKKGELNLQSGYFRNNSENDTTNKSWYLCAAPELTTVTEWLRLKKGLWIYTYPVEPIVLEDEPDYPTIVWVSKVVSLNQLRFEKFIDADNGLAINHHKSPQDAITAGINYLLKL